MAFTYFFRDLHTLNLIVKYVIPEATGCSRICIWDAGCAMGPEPYSLAMILAENMGRFAFKNVRIDATDIDESNLFEETISSGVYPQEQVKRIPREIFKKYFHQNCKPGYYQINDEIKRRLFYQKHNLLSLKPVGSGYSLVVCKNVLLHFKQEERINVIKMFHRVLVSGGFFATEQTQKLPVEMNKLFERVSNDGQLFRKV